MKILTDPETGELCEVLEDNLVSTEPYTYETFRRAAASVSLEHREAVKEARAASEALAKAEVAYRRALAVAIPEARATGPATTAEAVAKGSDPVLLVSEARDIAQARVVAAMERLRLCRDDRQVLLKMGEWSKSAEQWEAGG